MDLCEHVQNNRTTNYTIPWCLDAPMLCDSCWDEHWPQCDICREILREDQ